MTGRRHPVPLVILGAGGHAAVVRDAAEESAEFQVVAMLSDVETECGKSRGRVPVSGPIKTQVPHFPPHFAFALGIGDNSAREAYSAWLLASARHLPIIRHPRAWVSSSATLGPGTYVGANATINAGATIGSAVIVNTGAIIEHDCIIGDFCHLAPGACVAGGCHVEEAAFLGARCTLIPRIKISSRATVGAGAVVVRDVLPGRTVKGVPAS
ncbi:acetyltransferase [Hyphobacterium vulgare]|uniref:Acetyltransferase n=1 Tax=Hyphobacterium vulgare TaxID=1736751 RepID=A0ABV6ZVN1_9PROT